jgi:hypothetical protein
VRAARRERGLLEVRCLNRVPTLSGITASMQNIEDVSQNIIIIVQITVNMSEDKKYVTTLFQTYVKAGIQERFIFPAFSFNFVDAAGPSNIPILYCSTLHSLTKYTNSEIRKNMCYQKRAGRELRAVSILQVI